MNFHPLLDSPYSPFPPMFSPFPPIFLHVLPFYLFPPLVRGLYRELKVPPGPGYSGPCLPCPSLEPRPPPPSEFLRDEELCMSFQLPILRCWTSKWPHAAPQTDTLTHCCSANGAVEVVYHSEHHCFG